MSGIIQQRFGHGTVTRIAPLMPASAYKTYGWSMPMRTHWRPATCEEIDCTAYLNGWVTKIDLSTELGQRQYHYCTHDVTRKHTEDRVAPLLVELTYQPGNNCFQSGDHKLPVGRPAIFTVKDGDWRGNPRGTDVYVHASADNWVDDFTTHQDRLRTEIEKG